MSRLSVKQSEHYKDCSPIETVTKLKSILSKLGLDTEEFWIDDSCVGTASLRVQFTGSTVGANGKGVSHDYALASAYAELFERFQNAALGRFIPVEDTSDCRVSFDEKVLSAKDIIDENNAFIQFHSHIQGWSKLSKAKRIDAFQQLHRTDYLQYNVDDEYVCLPFYSLKTQRVTYLPKWVYSFYYGSNGMCAGNTPEEALVQGLSEIIERVAQKRIFIEKPTLPDVPDEYIQKFPYIYDMIKKLRSYDGYKVFMKDCSFGGKYPVAAFIIIKESTGEYGIKLGCHPDFGVAMERTITEAGQGQDILEYCNRSTLDFNNTGVTDADNIFNSYKTGLGQFPYEIFGDKPTYDFTPVMDVSEMSNREILLNWINDLKKQGFDILIRDVSYLGFPSYHIIIPGLSEVSIVTDTMFRAYNTRIAVTSMLVDISSVTPQNCKYILGTLGFFSKSLMENSLSSYYPEFNNLDLPYDDIHCGALYLAAMCHFAMKEYSAAETKIQAILKHGQAFGISEGQWHTLSIIRQYMSARSAGLNHKSTINYLTVFYSNSECTYIDDLFQDPDKVFIKQYPDLKNIAPDSKYKHSREQYLKSCTYMKILKEEQVKNPIDQINIEKLFD